MAYIFFLRVRRRAWILAAMTTSTANWVRGLREHLDLNQQQLAEEIGVTQPSVSRWERGHDEPDRASLARLYELAARASYPADRLALLLGRPLRSETVPVVGYAGAGGQVFPYDDHVLGQGLDEVDPPVRREGPMVAVRVRGDSMRPLRDGWLVFYSRDQDGVPPACLGELCVVRIAGDGPTLIKELRAGDGDGLFTLESWNAPPMKDVRIEWAARVIDIRPGH